MRLEVLGQLKHPMTSSGIEPVTFWLVILFHIMEFLHPLSLSLSFTNSPHHYVLRFLQSTDFHTYKTTHNITYNYNQCKFWILRKEGEAAYTKSQRNTLREFKSLIILSFRTLNISSSRFPLCPFPVLQVTSIQ
jgi:hypothetical protein